MKVGKRKVYKIKKRWQCLKDGHNFNWQGCGKSKIKAGKRTQHIPRLRGLSTKWLGRERCENKVQGALGAQRGPSKTEPMTM